MSASDWRTLDGIPLRDDEPVFDEPWQVQAFAMAVALHERGIFDWTDWAETLGKNITVHPQKSYWFHWLCALQEILERRNIADEETITERTRQWHDAAARTPHGQPIELQGGQHGDQP